MRKFIFLLLSGLSLSQYTMAQTVTIKVIQTSDVHGRVLAWNYAADEEDKSGSYAQISTLVKKIRKKNKNVILVEVGDAIQDNKHARPMEKTLFY